MSNFRAVRRNNLSATASFQPLRLVPFIRQEMVQRGEQKSAEPPALAIRLGNVVPLQHSSEKRLSQILRIVNRITLSSDTAAFGANSQKVEAPLKSFPSGSSRWSWSAFSEVNIHEGSIPFTRSIGYQWFTFSVGEM